MAVCLALTGLSFADNTSGTGTTPPTNQTPNNSGTRQGTGTGTGGTGTNRTGTGQTGTEKPTVSPSGAGTTQRGIDPTGSVPAGGSQMTGTVESVDRTGNKVRIRDAQGRITDYTFDPNTNFTSDGRKRRMSDVKAGDNVTFETNPDKGLLQFDFGTQPQNQTR